MKCTDCNLAYKCETNCMEGTGLYKSKIMFVGEAPTWPDDKSGEPFAGDS